MIRFCEILTINYQLERNLGLDNISWPHLFKLEHPRQYIIYLSMLDLMCREHTDDKLNKFNHSKNFKLD